MTGTHFVYRKGGYLDFSHLTELENICIYEIYMKKQHTSSISKNHTITKRNFFDGVSCKGYVAPKVIFRFCARNKKKKKHCGNIQ